MLTFWNTSEWVSHAAELMRSSAVLTMKPRHSHLIEKCPEKSWEAIEETNISNCAHLSV